MNKENWFIVSLVILFVAFSYETVVNFLMFDGFGFLSLFFIMWKILVLALGFGLFKICFDKRIELTPAIMFIMFVAVLEIAYTSIILYGWLV